jgi:hypothetical protein
MLIFSFKTETGTPASSGRGKSIKSLKDWVYMFLTLMTEGMEERSCGKDSSSTTRRARRMGSSERMNCVARSIVAWDGARPLFLELEYN